MKKFTHCPFCSYELIPFVNGDVSKVHYIIVGEHYCPKLINNKTHFFCSSKSENYMYDSARVYYYYNSNKTKERYIVFPMYGYVSDWIEINECTFKRILSSNKEEALDIIKMLKIFS